MKNNLNINIISDFIIPKESNYVIFRNEKISYQDFLLFAIKSFNFKKETENNIKKYYDKNTNEINKKIDYVLENYSNRITKFFSEIIQESKIELF